MFQVAAVEKRLLRKRVESEHSSCQRIRSPALDRTATLSVDAAKSGNAEAHVRRDSADSIATERHSGLAVSGSASVSHASLRVLVQHAVSASEFGFLQPAIVEFRQGFDGVIISFSSIVDFRSSSHPHDNSNSNDASFESIHERMDKECDDYFV